MSSVQEATQSKGTISMTTWAMLDLETMATDPDAQVLTIGAVKFDPFSWSDPHSEFYLRIDIEEQEQRGRAIDQGTLEWWGNQSAEAIEEAFTDRDRVSVTDMLTALKKWYVGCDEVWSQGSMDINILEHMYRQYSLPVPWPHWKVGDSRAFLRRMPTDPRKDKKFLEHHALEDAKAQVYALRKTLEHFGMKK